MSHNPSVASFCYVWEAQIALFASREVMRERHVNKNIYKPPTPEYIRHILTHNFTMEIEFYEYCKQRLYKQFLAVS